MKSLPAREVWIEITMRVWSGHTAIMSLPAREVWIEMYGSYIKST